MVDQNQTLNTWPLPLVIHFPGKHIQIYKINSPPGNGAILKFYHSKRGYQIEPALQFLQSMVNAQLLYGLKV